MTDWDGLAAMKYGIMQQQANADTTRANASANYDNARAGVVGAQAANDAALAKANIGHLGAQSQYLGAQTAEQRSSTAAMDSYGRGNIFDRMSGGGARGGAPGGMLSSTPIASQPSLGAPPMPSNFTTNASFNGAPKPAGPPKADWSQTNAASPGAGVKSVQPSYQDKDPEGGGVRMSGLKKGTARVPGKGSPKKDTVPAKLAPGEAVLNAPAAQMAGRGNIAALNRAGATQMGMRPGPGNMPGHYATGCANVQHYATGTPEVRSNDQRDLLPPVVGPTMSAPNDPRANLPPVVGPVMSAGPSPLPPVVGPAMYDPQSPYGNLPPVQGGGMSAPGEYPGPMPSMMPGVRAAAGGGAPDMMPPPLDVAPNTGLPYGAATRLWIEPPPVMQPQGPRGMRANLGAERARHPSAFEEAFAAARKAHGANSTFDFNGGKYTTNYASEPFKRQPRRA